MTFPKANPVYTVGAAGFWLERHHSLAVRPKRWSRWFAEKTRDKRAHIARVAAVALAPPYNSSNSERYA